MSGPATSSDAEPVSVTPSVASGIEVVASRSTEVGGVSVRRALPTRGRRTVGPWCFADHLGPVDGARLDVGPHPHLGLHTVTWLLAGELLHRDSIGSEQLIRPGQLNLMTAGHGVSHAEEGTGAPGPIHGIQLWVAQPSATRDGMPAFEHHAELPQVDLGGALATVLLGDLAGAVSPARRDSPAIGVDLALSAGATTAVSLDAGFEHAVVVLDGALVVDGLTIEPGNLAYLGIGRASLVVAAARPSRALLLGGAPFEEPLLMWWNYVARTRDEVVEAHRAWTERTDRFGVVSSRLPRVDVPPPPWVT